MSDHSHLDRRQFLKSTAAGIGAAGLASQALGKPAEKEAVKVDPKKLIWKNKKDGMEYHRLGRTNFMASKIVAGWIRDDKLVRRVVANGVNYLDTARGYGEYEVALKPLLAKVRDNVWVTSKATGVAGYNKIDDKVKELYLAAMESYLGKDEVKEYMGKDGGLLNVHKKAVARQKESGEKPDLRPAGKRIAEMYSSMLDESLKRMDIEYVDCYFVHGVEIPWMFDCVELWEAYSRAHKAGKVKHFGFSTHTHQKEVLAAAAEANDRGPWKIDLTMPGVNPESFDHLKPELTKLKKQDVGVVAMKTTGIKNRPVDGREQKFKAIMGGKEYNEWERSKLWMLHLTEELVDSVIAGVSNTDEMGRTLALPSVKLNAAAEQELRAIVKMEMSGACHLCGDCETHCPEHISVTDMVRYHAYIHQYDDRELALSLYKQHGYDPSKVCTNCGKCEDACSSHVGVTKLLNELSQSLS